MKPYSVLIALLLLCIASQAQTQWSEITMKGRVSKINLSDSTEHLLNDTPIEIWVDDSLSSTIYTDEKGRYKFSLPFFHNYELKYGREPFVQKSVEIDATDFSQTTMTRGFRLEIDITLFEDFEVPEFGFLSREPVAIASYNKVEDTVIWNAEHTETINQKIREAIKQNLK